MGSARAATGWTRLPPILEMQDIANDMVKYVEVNAPKDTTRLSKSGAPWVDDNGMRTYQRPPKAPRRSGDAPTGWHRE